VIGIDSATGEGKNDRYKIFKEDEVKSQKWGKKSKKSFLVLWEAMKKFNGDHGFFLSAGITFNLLICLVPFILLLLALLGAYLYSYREVLDHIRHYLQSALPSFDPRIMKNILKIIQDRKIVGVLGIGGLIWTSTWVFSSLRTALNMVFQVDKGRSVIRGKGIDLLMILLAGTFLLTSMLFTSVITIVQGYRFSPFLNMIPIIRFILKYLIPFLFTFWMCFLIYKIIPKKKIHFKTALQTAFFTSLFWEVAKQFFGWYILRLGRFSMVYGSLSTLAIFFIWVYYSSAILILGGEVAFLLEKERGYK
jgi:membrane protein